MTSIDYADAIKAVGITVEMELPSEEVILLKLKSPDGKAIKGYYLFEAKDEIFRANETNGTFTLGKKMAPTTIAGATATMRAELLEARLTQLLEDKIPAERSKNVKVGLHSITNDSMANFSIKEQVSGSSDIVQGSQMTYLLTKVGFQKAVQVMPQLCKTLTEQVQKIENIRYLEKELQVRYAHKLATRVSCQEHALNTPSTTNFDYNPSLEIKMPHGRIVVDLDRQGKYSTKLELATTNTTETLEALADYKLLFNHIEDIKVERMIKKVTDAVTKVPDTAVAPEPMEMVI